MALWLSASCTSGALLPINIFLFVSGTQLRYRMRTPKGIMPKQEITTLHILPETLKGAFFKGFLRLSSMAASTILSLFHPLSLAYSSHTRLLSCAPLNTLMLYLCLVSVSLSQKKKTPFQGR
jgi:hypothetical protein